MDQLVGAFTVPPHVFGPRQAPRSARERGKQELEEIRRFEGAYPGVRLHRSEDAAAVEADENLRLMGLRR